MSGGHTQKKKKKGGPLIVDEKMKRLRFKKLAGWLVLLLQSRPPYY